MNTTALLAVVALSLSACTVGSPAGTDAEFEAFMVELESTSRKQTVTPGQVENEQGSLDVANVIHCPDHIQATVATEYDDPSQAWTGWKAAANFAEPVKRMVLRDDRTYGTPRGPTNIDHVEVWCASDRRVAKKLVFLLGQHIPEYHDDIEEAAIRYGAEVLPFSECYEIQGLNAAYCE